MLTDSCMQVTSNIMEATLEASESSDVPSSRSKSTNGQGNGLEFRKSLVDLDSDDEES